jgi:putative membrane protein insertion efficiency factor
MNALTRLATLPLRAYRRWISPLKPPTCRFQPTCSAYAIEALETHGLLRGTRLSLWRVLRCQPFARHGHDPVPPRRAAPPPHAR